MDVVQRIVSAQESSGNGRDAEGVQIAFLNSPVEGFNLTVSISSLAGTGLNVVLRLLWGIREPGGKGVGVLKYDGTLVDVGRSKRCSKDGRKG